MALAEITPAQWESTALPLSDTGSTESLCAAQRPQRYGSVTDTVHAGRPFLKTAERESLDGTCAVGIRPACVSMLAAVVITLSGSTFLSGEFIIRWNLVLIALITGGAMYKFRLSVPKTMLLAAGFGADCRIETRHNSVTVQTVCAFAALTMRKGSGGEHPAHRAAI